MGLCLQQLLYKGNLETRKNIYTTLLILIITTLDENTVFIIFSAIEVIMGMPNHFNIFINCKILKEFIFNHS